MTVEEQLSHNRYLAENHARHSTEYYALVIDTIQCDPLKGLVGYRVINRRTGVAEGEGMTEDAGIRAIHRYQKDLEDALRDPHGVSTELPPELRAIFSGQVPQH